MTVVTHYCDCCGKQITSVVEVKIKANYDVDKVSIKCKDLCSECWYKFRDLLNTDSGLKSALLKEDQK